MPTQDMTLQASVTTLYSEHHGWLHGWLHKRLGNGFDAADLMQDTFVRVLKARNSLDIREPRVYLATIAKGLLIDLFRRRSLEKAYMEALGSLPEYCLPSLEEQAIILETLNEIDVMLNGLPAKVKQAFLLAQLQGLTHMAIAQRLGVSLRTVGNYLAQAMEHCCLLDL